MLKPKHLLVEVLFLLYSYMNKYAGKAVLDSHVFCSREEAVFEREQVET